MTAVFQILTYSQFLTLNLFPRNYATYCLSYNYGLTFIRVCTAAVLQGS
jgi:hypothetical protein